MAEYLKNHWSRGARQGEEMASMRSGREGDGAHCLKKEGAGRGLERRRKGHKMKVTHVCCWS